MDNAKPSEKVVVPIIIGLILVLVLTITLILYIKKTRFIYRIKAASRGRRNCDIGYEEFKG